MKKKQKNTKDIFITKNRGGKDGEKKNQNKEGATEGSPKPFEPPNIGFFKLFRFATCSDICLMIFGVAGSVVTGLSAPMNTLIFGDLTDALVKYKTNTSMASNEFLDSIDKFALNNSIIGLVLLFVSYISIIAFNKATQNQIYRIRTLYLKSALRQEIGWYDLNNTGDFASRMSDDLNKVEDGLCEKILQVVHCMSAFLGCITLAMIKGWELALICLSSLPVIAGIIGLIAFLSSKLSKTQLAAYAKAGTVAEEVLSSVRTVVAFSGQEKESERYNKYLLEAKKNNFRKCFFNGIIFGMLWFLIYGTYGFSFWFGVGFVYDSSKHYTAGQMTTVFFSVMIGSMNFGIATPFIEIFSVARAAGMVPPFLSTLASFYVVNSNKLTSAAKVYWVMDRKSEIDPTSEKGLKPERIEGNIEFRNIHFRYPSRPDILILKGISFKINKGETVALVGSSGCGKSTCIQLLQRFYDPLEGQVLIDGEDIRNINVKHLRKHIGIVGQEPILFAAPIKDNIRYSKENATMAEVIAAAQMANAHPFINKLPQEYDTTVGDRGAQMSGGQKQRIAIARALIRDPCILLLDEATSALDTASEAKVQAALDKASKGRTTIIVAHRLSTIRQADKIIVMSKGEIVEEGTHSELIQKQGHYFDLVTAQTTALDQLEKDIGFESEDKETKYMKAEFDEEEVVEYYKPETKLEDKKRKEKKIALWEIMKLSSPEWLIISIATIACMAMGCASPFFSIVFGDIMGVFKHIRREDAMEEAKTYCTYFALIGVLMGVSTFVQVWVYGIAGEILTMRLRSQTFIAMLKQEMAWFDDKANSVGALCARLSGDTSNVQGATGQPIGSVVQGIATISLSIGFAMYFQWKLGLTALSLTPFLFAGSYFMASNLKGSTKSNREALEKSTKLAVEGVGNIKTVAGLGREESLWKEYEKELRPTIKAMMKSTHLRAITMGVSRSLMFFAYALCMFYGGRLIYYENEDYTNVLKVTQTLIMASFSLANAFAFAPNFQKGLVSANKILTFLSRVPKIKDPDKTPALRDWSADGNVSYSQVNFKYPSRPDAQVLKKFGLAIAKGKKIALVGQSGCGKSTVVQLLERFYDPDEGTINLDFYEIRTLKLDVLRKQLGIVSQEPVLFDKTIADNIAYGDNDREVTLNEIIEAAKQANIHDFVSNLPLGYETTLGEKGTQLSGGQKQRIAIARALIRKPKVLLLDEATSALDTQSEKVVQDALDKASSGRTCITIAHRLSTIQDADLIAVISQGKVAEMGTHSELIAKKGIYRQLYTLQGK